MKPSSLYNQYVYIINTNKKVKQQLQKENYLKHRIIIYQENLKAVMFQGAGDKIPVKS